MNNEINQMILSYPANYSDKEVVKVMWAEAGQIVSEETVRKVRQAAKEDALIELVDLVTIAARQDRRRNDPRFDMIGRLKPSLTGDELDRMAAKHGAKFLK